MTFDGTRKKRQMPKEWSYGDMEIRECARWTTIASERCVKQDNKVSPMVFKDCGRGDTPRPRSGFLHSDCRLRILRFEDIPWTTLMSMPFPITCNTS